MICFRIIIYMIFKLTLRLLMSDLISILEFVDNTNKIYDWIKLKFYKINKMKK